MQSNFRSLKHPHFKGQKWDRLADTLDGIFAAMGPGLEAISWKFETVPDEENNGYGFVYGGIHWPLFYRDWSARKLISDDELDLVPYVRRLERDNDILFYLFPIECDTDAGTVFDQDSLEVRAERSRFHFEKGGGDIACTTETTMEIGAEWLDMGWQPYARAAIVADGLTLSDVLIDPLGVFLEYSDLETVPQEILGITARERAGAQEIVFDLPLDTFAGSPKE